MAPTSLISAGTELTGRLKCASDLRCDGRLAGEVEVSGHLTIGAGAVVEGPLRARTVTVLGEVRGPVQAAERLELQRGAAVRGDIVSACVVLANGCELDGRIDIAE